ncbi:bcl-2 homologous antagonist/killer-like [Rhincodon typus]|uniref:bcl-2 homologous antagonist/killer-like n=1 Tax=Rhincodon typus TaxID=259920 RepID=UPI00202E7A70|nr:bcl-2 homologous antagonist/killer-like [Rhincodon typus]
MATRNSDDPCRSSSSHKRKVIEVDTEQGKVNEAENLFQNTVYYENQSEMEENIENGMIVPDLPVTTNQTSPSSIMEIGRQLAIVGDELNHQKNREFQDVQAYLSLPSEFGYQSFRRSAERLYDNGINWSQTIGLLSLGYKMMTYVYQRAVTGCFGKATKSVAKFIAKNQIAQWIVEHAAWTTALSIENANLKWLFGILLAVMLSVAITQRFINHE